MEIPQPCPKCGTQMERPADLLAQLSHPRIVSIYDRVEQDGVYLFDPEYVKSRKGRTANFDDRHVRPLAYVDDQVADGSQGETLQLWKRWEGAGTGP